MESFGRLLVINPEGKTRKENVFQISEKRVTIGR